MWIKSRLIICEIQLSRGRPPCLPVQGRPHQPSLPGRCAASGRWQHSCPLTPQSDSRNLLVSNHPLQLLLLSLIPATSSSGGRGEQVKHWTNKQTLHCTENWLSGWCDKKTVCPDKTEITEYVGSFQHALAPVMSQTFFTFPSTDIYFLHCNAFALTIIFYWIFFLHIFPI